MQARIPLYLNYILICFLIIGATAIPFLSIIAIILIALRSKFYINVKKSDADKVKTMEEDILAFKEKTEKDMALQKQLLERELNLKEKEKLNELDALNKESLIMKREINALNHELLDLQADVNYEYANVTTYDEYSSEEIKNEEAKLRLREKELIRNNEAVLSFSRDEKKSIINAQIRQLLRSFNNEADIIIAKTTSKNIDNMREKLTRAFEALNKLYKVDNVKLSNELLDIKLERLNAVYQYQLKLEIEKEQRQAIKEQMLEEEKVRREIETAKKKLDKEEHQFKNKVDRLLKYMQKATNDIEKNIYADKIKELEEKLSQLEETRKDVINREQNTRAGFVYIISNIGSFGENIFKIGMTRRLEPMDRIKELSSASVPFEFDVHAIIFSEDAPALENTLHQTFQKNQVNKINFRKEFFNIPLESIEKVVTQNHNAAVNWTFEAPATEYRESLKLLES